MQNRMEIENTSSPVKKWTKTIFYMLNAISYQVAVSIHPISKYNPKYMLSIHFYFSTLVYTKNTFSVLLVTFNISTEKHIYFMFYPSH